jgi:hypothetical protein
VGHAVDRDIHGTAPQLMRKEVTVPNERLNTSYHRRSRGDVMFQIVATLRPRSLRSAHYAAGTVTA